MAYKDEYREQMREYFKERLDENKAAGRTRDKEIASIPALALHIGITTNELKSYEGGSDEAQDFYQEFMTRYEMLCDQYVAAGHMTAKHRADLAETLFARTGGDDKTGIHIVFNNWNAPDDYEHYLKIKKACDDGGLTLNGALVVLKQHIEENL